MKLKNMIAERDTIYLESMKDVSSISCETIKRYQKLTHDIFIYQNFLFLLKTAPRSMDREKIRDHFRTVKNFVEENVGPYTFKKTNIQNVYSYVNYLKETLVDIGNKEE